MVPEGAEVEEEVSSAAALGLFPALILPWGSSAWKSGRAKLQQPSQSQNTVAKKKRNRCTRMKIVTWSACSALIGHPAFTPQ